MFMEALSRNLTENGPNLHVSHEQNQRDGGEGDFHDFVLQRGWGFPGAENGLNAHVSFEYCKVRGPGGFMETFSRNVYGNLSRNLTENGSNLHESGGSQGPKTV